jgi:hypothetical protein
MGLREADGSQTTCFCRNLGSFEEEGDGTGEDGCVWRESFISCVLVVKMSLGKEGAQPTSTVQFPDEICRPDVHKILVVFKAL